MRTVENFLSQIRYVTKVSIKILAKSMAREAETHINLQSMNKDLLKRVKVCVYENKNIKGTIDMSDLD